MIFVGLDGADWTMLEPLIADGTMPHLARLVREGDRRVLLTQHPPLSPLVWTSMMTGLSPLEHRILDFTRFNPTTHVREPITSDERAVPAIWNMVTSKGRAVDVYGLWATYPAETINGRMVSDRLFSYQYDEKTIPPGAVSPASDEPRAREVVAKTSERIGLDELRKYVPSLTAEEYAAAMASANPFENKITALRRIVIETEVVHQLATARATADLTIVYFQGTDAIGHLFAPYYGLDSPYSGVPRAYFARIDAILGDYLELAEKQKATLIIASDHGFAWNARMPAETSLAAATAAKWHREEGIYVEWPRHGRVPERPHVIELCSILLDRLGMPTDVREYRRGFKRAAAATTTTTKSDEELAKLKALGYIGSAEPSRTASSSTRTAGSFNNEGLILRENGRNAEAIAAFEGAIAVDPRNASALWNLSDLLRSQHEDKRADELLDRAIAIDATQPRWLLTRGRRRLERKDCRAAREDFAAATRIAANDALAFASLATAEMCLGETAKAQDDIKRSLAIDPNQPELRRFLQ